MIGASSADDRVHSAVQPPDEHRVVITLDSSWHRRPTPIATASVRRR